MAAREVRLKNIENVRIGNKIPAREISTRDLLVRLGQEYRLSLDEIDELIAKVIDE